MADPHNKERYGETWDQGRIDEYIRVIKMIKEYVIVSGGFAWHFMSPKGHVEYKHAHDHKDVDLFVIPEFSGIVIGRLQLEGFKKTPTRYDTKGKKFVRYEKQDGKLKLTFDLFFDKVPYVGIQGFKVIDPRHLLSLYKSIHSTDNCWAVQAAYKLVKKGYDPIGREELTTIPK